ncbi:MAG: YegS/Rv2252/BmrU family lipid kinase [Streptosporangiales bacterium]|nr:YegS/Rv2252/BmrU family lipid kinase [Streptosporangiales bacterium]
MARRVDLLVNPTSGGGRGLRVLGPAVERLRDGGAEVRVVQGRDAAEAADLARAAVADRPDALVALGGDGLIHLAVQALAETGIPLGIVPAGTANDLARVLGIPLGDPPRAVDVILGGVTRAIDAGRCGDQWFSNVVSCGLDAVVSERAGRLHRIPGHVRYLAALAAELPKFRPVPFTLELDGEEWRTDAMLVAVGNSSTYGTGMRICPDAQLDDGLLDVVVLHVSRVEVACLFPLVYRGWHLRYPRVTARRARTVSIAAPGLTAYTAGERLAGLPLTCEAVQGALRVFVPPGIADAE